MDDVRAADKRRQLDAIATNAFANFQITEDSKHKTPEAELISQFMEEVNKERPEGSFYIKNGKKVKLKPLTFMGTRSSKNIIGIANDAFELEHFLKECKDYKQRNGSFSKRFFGGFKKHDWQ